MIIGCLKEIKDNENRVALTPAGTKTLVSNRHTVLVEAGAGLGSGFPDKEYSDSGAELVSSPEQIASRSELVVKIKEPLESEYSFFKKGQLIFTYFHFASNRKLTDAMLSSGATCIAYETVEVDGKTPLLAPMSEVAGKMAPLMGSFYLSKPAGGKGLLFSGVTGVSPAVITVIGGGVVGQSAAQVASGLGADLTILEKSSDRIMELKNIFPNAKILESTLDSITETVKKSDVVVGAVYIPGSRAPKIVSEEMVSSMKPGSVIVDVAIDQGGIFETSHPTTHSNPVFEKYGVIHYCVANMPGAFPRTSTIALTNSTLSYIQKLAKAGFSVFKSDKEFAKGVNIVDGKITNQGVASAHSLDFTPVEELV